MIEGEALACRAMIGGAIMCTVNGSLACSPVQSVAGVLLAQMPLSPGASGSPIFDAQGQLVGIVIGPLSESITDFARAWSSDVIRDALVREFGSAVDDALAATWTSDSDSRNLKVAATSKELFEKDDILLEVGTVKVSSYYELVCVVTPLLERKTNAFAVSVLRNGYIVKVLVNCN